MKILNKHRNFGDWKKILNYVFLLATLLLAPHAFSQVVVNGIVAIDQAETPAGTVITSQAFGDYKDSAGNQAPRVTSNVVSTTVSAVHAVFVQPPAASKSGTAGTQASFAFEVINAGNETDSIDVAPSGTPPADWIVSIVLDANGDGLYQPEETQLSDSTGPLEPGASIKYHLLVTPPGSTPDDTSGVVEVTATSDGDTSKTAMGAYTLNVSAGVAEVTKFIVDTTTYRPGDIVTYEISTVNTGSITIDNSTTIDFIPTGTTYVAGSMRHGPLGSAYNVATPLTDADDADDVADFNITNPGAISIGPGDLIPGEVSDSIFFQVAINVELEAGVTIANVALESYAGPNGQIEVESNSVTFTVDAVGDTTILPPLQVKTAEVSQQVTFYMTVTNGGNASDTINFTAVSTDGYPWVFYSATGNPPTLGTPLTDTDADGNVDTGPVAAGGVRAFAVVATVPIGETDGTADITTITAFTSITQSSEGSNVAVLTTTIVGPRVTLSKTVEPTGAVPPGTTLTYTVTLTNAGTGNAYDMVVQDSIPEWTTYVSGSMEGSVDGSAFAPVTDAADGDGARFDIGSNAVISDPTTVGPTSSGTLRFRVIID